MENMLCIFLGLLALHTVQSAYVCNNRHRQCAAQARRGQCISNYYTMHIKCCRSCVIACQDKLAGCPAAARKGRCDQFKVLKNCPSSCGMCCADTDNRCPAFARLRKCATNAKEMAKYCLKSCSACNSPCGLCRNVQYSIRGNLEGFHVRAEIGVFDRWPLLKAALVRDLLKLKTVVPRPAVQIIQRESGLYINRLKICSSYPNCGVPRVPNYYHEFTSDLRLINDAPAKAGFVEVMNPEEYLLRRSHTEKYNLLHVFFHAWFDIRRRAALQGDRFSIAKLTVLKAAWLNAKSKGLYRQVPHLGGGSQPGHAIKNVREYLAELSEAFFARGINDVNDYYPYNRVQLMKYDLAGYKAIQAMWGAPYPVRVAPAGTPGVL